ncbi:MAG: hypothetical protein ABI240_04575 [Sphingomonas sp.]
MLPPQAVIDIASILGDDERAFIVGGQALNLWAEYYAETTPELEAYRPFTSKDIDYFGQRNVAEKLAKGLGGSVRVPNMDDATFQTAIVDAKISGIDVSIDFLAHVLGIRRGLEDGVVDLTIPYRLEDREGEIDVRLMHPLHCLQSRVANIITLKRPDETARRQAEAAPIVLREFISDALRDGEHKDATDTMRALFAYLRRDYRGRDAHRHITRDPLDVLRHFTADDRLDERYRRLTLEPMVREIEGRRGLLGRLLNTVEQLGRRDSAA